MKIFDNFKEQQFQERKQKCVVQFYFLVLTSSKLESYE